MRGNEPDRGQHDDGTGRRGLLAVVLDRRPGIGLAELGAMGFEIAGRGRRVRH